MGSVIDFIECPRCKEGNCFDDYNYKTGEEFVSCPDCGYHRRFTYKRGEDGNFIKKDESKGYEFDNLVSEEVHFDNPFGAFRVENTLGGATGGTLETEDDYDKFVSEMVSMKNQEHNIKTATISKLVDGEIIREVVFE